MKKYMKTKELKVKEILDKSTLLNYSYYNQIIDSSCSKFRPDFVFEYSNITIILEVDEHQHKNGYNCETKRMSLIAQTFIGNKVLFIRFNPDKYIDNSNDRKNPRICNRMKNVIHIINYFKDDKKMPNNFGYIELYYDSYNNGEILDKKYNFIGKIEDLTDYYEDYYKEMHEHLTKEQLFELTGLVEAMKL